MKMPLAVSLLRVSPTYSQNIRRLWEALSLLELQTQWDRTLTGTVSTAIGSVEETTAGACVCVCDFSLPVTLKKKGTPISDTEPSSLTPPLVSKPLDSSDLLNICRAIIHIVIFCPFRIFKQR